MIKKRGRKPKRPEKKKFEEIYYDEKVTAKDLAKLFEVSDHTIYNWAYEFRKKNKK